MSLEKKKSVKGLSFKFIRENEMIHINPRNSSCDIEPLLGRVPLNRDILEGIRKTKVPLQRAMEDLFRRLLWCQLHTMGWFTGREEKVSDLFETTGIAGRFHRWMEESLRILSGADYIRYNGETCAPGKKSAPDHEESWALWEERKQPWLQEPGMNTQVVLTERMLKALPEVLRGTVLPTDIMFPGSSMELVEGIYKNNVLADYYNEILADVVLEYVRGAGEKVRIIEIGAGTGGSSAVIFRKLKELQDRVEEYRYTDLSRAFLMHCEKEYLPGNPYITTGLLDIGISPSLQDVSPGSYDIVIGANVLHATPDIRKTVRNAKGLLKGKGLILLNEIAVKSLFTHLTFGLLEGWWLYEDEELRIQGNPGLSPENWKKVLGEEGFPEVFYPAELAHDLGQQIILGISDGVNRLEIPRDKSPESSVVKTKTIKTVKRKRVRKKAAGGTDVTDRMIEDHVRGTLRECIAGELKMDESEVDDERSLAEYGVDSIIAVQLINSVNDALFITLKTTDLFDYNNVNTLTEFIIKENKEAIKGQLGGSAGTGVVEEEYEEEIVVPGEPVPPAGQGGTRFGKSAAPAAPAVPAAFPGEGRYQRVLIQRPGDFGDLKTVESAIAPLAGDEVRIAVRAFSLNFGDLLCLRGLYPTMPPYPFTPGYEVSGVVVETGKGVSRFFPGDEVVGILGRDLGGHATMAVCQEHQVFTKPSRLSFEEACSLPAVAITMIAVFRKAALKPGERILVQTATGGTGLIALQLARHYGGEIYATAGAQHKLDYLEKLGVPYRINYQEKDFEQEIMALTGGEGVDVVINTLAGDAIQKGMNCLRAGGRYIEIAMTALKSARQIDLSSFTDNQTFHSIDMRKLSFTSPGELAEYHREMLELIEAGIINPTIHKIIPWNRIEEAYKALGNRANIGKVVVSIPGEMIFSLPGEAVSAGRGASPEEDLIAIVGMSGRFAHSPTVEDLWGHLAAGDCLVDEITRWDLSRYYPGDMPFCNYGGFLERIDAFDPLFFNISGFEATYMDPQQRIFLEESWKALEDAGYAGDAAGGRLCGVYVGCINGDYPRLFPDDPPPQALWGNSASILAARISYFLNLQGPAISIDTACSSSLVAIHLASQGLIKREMDMALAGGVFVQSTPNSLISMEKSHMLSLSGLCHSFDEKADGFVTGEGAGVLVLKRLKDALEDRDHIYAVIRGSGINQDGTTNGILAPSAVSQERLERWVYDTYGIDPGDIQMVEAHGTATKLGDPIEYAALSRAFRNYTEKEEFCAIGSIKTNIGHAATAAGIAGIIKVLLSLKHKQMPPSLHFKTRNTRIEFEGSPFFVNTHLRDWEVPAGKKRLGAVSSFGFSGTNAHMVIEEPPVVESRKTESPGFLVVLSAKNEEQLAAQTGRLVSFMEKETGLDLGDVCYTLLTGRKHFNHRLSCVVRNKEELLKYLKKWLEKKSVPGVKTGDLTVTANREEPALKRHGNECIEKCRVSGNSGEYVENLSAVADLYVQGYKLEYSRLFAGKGNYRVSLPSYPFSTGSFWVEEREDVEIKPIASVRKAVPGEPEAPDLFFIPAWEEESSAAVCKMEKGQKALVVSFPGSRELGALISSASREKGLEVLEIELGEETSRVSDNRWICGEKDLQGFGTCLADRESFDFLYFAASFPVENQDHFVMEEVQRSCTLQLLRLIKLVKEDYTGQRMNCYVITTGSFSLSEAPVNPLGAGLTGLAYSMAQSDYRISLRNIDLCAEDLADSQEQARLFDLIVNTKASEKGREVKISRGRYYRRGFRTLERRPGTRGIRKGGVYLIIGGSGAVGRGISRNLINHHEAGVIWIGRRPETAVEDKINEFKTLSSIPAYYQCDVKNQDELRETLKKIKESYPVINGVIFSALVFNVDNSISKTTEEEFLQIFTLKSVGGVNTYEVFKEEPLDFFCFFSSAQGFSFSGASHFSAYAAAITASDNFVHYLAGKAPFPVGAINWGFWQRDDYDGDLFNTSNISFLEYEEGYFCFEEFVFMLREDVIRQAVCMKTNAMVRELMDIKPGKVSLSPRSGTGLFPVLLKEFEAEACEVNGKALEELKEIEELAARFLLIQLPGEPGTVKPLYGKFFKEAREILKVRGLFQPDQPCPFSREEEVQIRREWEELKQKFSGHPAWKAQLRMLDAGLRNLPALLKGEVLAAQVMFPGGAVDLIGDTYKQQEIYCYADNLVAGLVELYVTRYLAADPGGTVRILEVGAGTGSTSEKIFRKVEKYKDNIEYCYTDISLALVEHGKTAFGDQYPFTSFKVWNLEERGSKTGISPGQYDLVVASNVLHATRNIRTTLLHVKEALCHKGVLIINELTEKLLLPTLTFGLFEGWWLSEDQEYRIPGSPLLSSGNWKRALGDTGFRPVALPRGADPGLIQQVFFARSDGLLPVPGSVPRAKAPEKTAGKSLSGKPGKTAGTAVKKPGQAAEKEGVKTPGKAGKSPRGKKVLKKASSPKIVKQKTIDVKEYIRETLHVQFAEALKISRESIKTNVSFSEYGLDSVMGVSFVKKISDVFGFELNSAILFDYATIDQLTDYLLMSYEEEILENLKKEQGEDILEEELPEEEDLYEEVDENSGEAGDFEDNMIDTLEEEFFRNNMSSEEILKQISRIEKMGK